MEDVIFAGTASRPPRAFAEVSLLTETADGEERDITRRIERGAGSAYRLNGSDVRAKDIALYFADAATGAHSPALVSQGRIAAVIAAKPAERRQMLEEAAGISGLHVRRKDAEQKLRATETNLARLEDLLSQLDSRMATLRRQARAAEKYRELSDQIRLGEAQLLYMRWREAAAAADAARRTAKECDAAVAAAQEQTGEAQKAQRDAAVALASAREDMADRRDDVSAQANLLTMLTGRLEAAEEKLADLDRQFARLDRDEGDAEENTRNAAEAMTRLTREIAAAQRTLTEDQERSPKLAAAQEDAERAGRAAELALAQATAEQARVEAEWRVADAAVRQAQSALDRAQTDLSRREADQAALGSEDEARDAVTAADVRVNEAAATREKARSEIEEARTARDAASARRDAAASALSSARAELAGVEREHEALLRDKRAREKADKSAKGHRRAIDAVKAAPGYERALAAVLGRDGAGLLTTPAGGEEGRFWTGADAPAPLADSLAAHVRDTAPELAARLALVRVADEDNGQLLGPGEWLVTMAGSLRRWDGFVARGEGAAQAAMLEAANRLDALAAQLPELQEALAKAESEQAEAHAGFEQAREANAAAERALAAAADAERSALLARDQAGAALERLQRARAGLAEQIEELTQRVAAARTDLSEAEEQRATLPDPTAQREARATAQARHEAARGRLQQAMAEHASLEQAIAVGTERINAMRTDMRGWEARSGDAARRLAEVSRRREEIAEERAITAAKPESLQNEIEQASAARDRLTAELDKAQAAHTAAETASRRADAAFAQANEALAAAREARAGASARAENEEARRSELARESGERFHCPPPLLATRIGFDSEEAARISAQAHAQQLDTLNAQRERLGPVNLVAADELAEAEAEHGSSAAEQAELAEAVNRLRGSIGSLNREGRERLRAAFDAVDEHFRSLFSTLFGGGQAHLALVDSDDPLEAGLEIYAQPPGKKLQSLTLLSGGEQALTAVALIFALFLTNPAPICVLDEVDAPLDDANIERFCDLLEAMTKQTQTRYLIVTHNAVTMSRMHRLFGVTMVEQGVSRLVSVDLGGAEELLAAE